MAFGVILDTFLQMLQNSKQLQHVQAKCLVWEVLGLRFGTFFAYFLNVFFVLLSRRTFCSILADLGLQKGSVLESILADFANFACNNDMLKSGSKIDDFWRTFGRPPDPILGIWESFQGALWDFFAHFFAGATKLKKCNPFKRNACFGRCRASVFAFVLLIF